MSSNIINVYVLYQTNTVKIKKKKKYKLKLNKKNKQRNIYNIN